MNKPKLLIAESGEELRMALAERFADRCSVEVSSNGEEALALARSFCPDILVLDLALPRLDGISLLQKLRQEGLYSVVLAQMLVPSPYISESLQRLEVDYAVLKPCDLSALEARIQDFIDRLGEAPVQKQQDLTDVLLAMHFKASHGGYGYLRSAIPMYAQDPTQAVTKELYVSVGAPLHKDARLVERSIRNAIERAWEQGDMQVWHRYFPAAPDGTVHRPSNGAFIARMAELLRDGICCARSA